MEINFICRDSNLVLELCGLHFFGGLQGTLNLNPQEQCGVLVFYSESPSCYLLNEDNSIRGYNTTYNYESHFYQDSYLQVISVISRFMNYRSVLLTGLSFGIGEEVMDNDTGMLLRQCQAILVDHPSPQHLSPSLEEEFFQRTNLGQ